MEFMGREYQITRTVAVQQLDIEKSLFPGFNGSMATEAFNRKWEKRRR